jgi:hypothetical protein
MSTLHVLRIQQPDGSWKFDMDAPMGKRDADAESKKNRIWLGVLCQVWSEKEAAAIVAKHEVAVSTA